MSYTLEFATLFKIHLDLETAKERIIAYHHPEKIELHKKLESEYAELMNYFNTIETLKPKVNSTELATKIEDLKWLKTESESLADSTQSRKATEYPLLILA